MNGTRSNWRRNFDYCVLPMSAGSSFSRRKTPSAHRALDEWVEMLSKRRVPTIAGPLVRLDESNVPDWMVIWEHDFDMLREMAYDYVQKVVQRYRRAVAAWNVVAGLQTQQRLRTHLRADHRADPAAGVAGQDPDPQRAHDGDRSRIRSANITPASRASVPPMMYAEMVAQAGISFEAFALELELGVPAPGMFIRDLFQFSTLAGSILRRWAGRCS